MGTQRGQRRYAEDDYEEDDRRRRPRERGASTSRRSPPRSRKSSSGIGLWIGLGIGGVAVVAGIVVLVIVLGKKSDSKDGSGDDGDNNGLADFKNGALSGKNVGAANGKTGKKFVGKWEWIGGNVGGSKFIEFAKNGDFLYGSRLLKYGTYSITGFNELAVDVNTRKIRVNGVEAKTIRIKFIRDDELEMRYLGVFKKFRKVKDE